MQVGKLCLLYMHASNKFMLTPGMLIPLTRVICIQNPVLPSFFNADTKQSLINMPMRERLYVQSSEQSPLILNIFQNMQCICICELVSYAYFVLCREYMLVTNYVYTGYMLITGGICIQRLAACPTLVRVQHCV